MTGRLDETYLTAIQKEQDENQYSLYDYSDEDSNHTRIAVVSEPNDTGILEATDEFMPELGMPEDALRDFRYLREGFNATGHVRRHNKAFDKANLDSIYRGYLRYDEDAEEAMREIEQRLQDGENITLVCFEKPPKKCHRHILKEFIEQRMNFKA